MDVSSYIKKLRHLSATLRGLQSPKKPLHDHGLLEALRRTIAEAKALELDGLVEVLEANARDLDSRMTSALEQRRESLLNAAKTAGLAHKRFGSFDRVGPFKVTYRGRKVRLDLGSELVSEFEESDGAAILDRIREQLESLESNPFSREAFFRAVKGAVCLARERNEARDGWAPARLVYLYVSFLQNLETEDFVRRPSSRTFRDYSTAQFVYDLARFGRSDWVYGTEVLRGQGPNMAGVAAGQAITLPRLEGVEQGEQIARFRIDRVVGNGS